jgi:hypothetical protein
MFHRVAEGDVVRATKVLMMALGVVMLVSGVAGLAWALSTDTEAALGVGITGATFVCVGAGIMVTALYIGRLDNSKLLREGTPATAQVLSTRDTGVMVNNVNLVVELELLVTVPGRAPYEARARHVLQGRTQWGAIQPGMTVAVKVDPSDPATVAVDPEGGMDASGLAALLAGAAAPGTPTSSTPTPGAAPPGAPTASEVVPVSAAAIVAGGVATVGRLEQAAPTGMVAGQVAQGLAAAEADDPVLHVSFSYTGPGGTTLRQTALMRVPDGKAEHLVPGAVIPVAYLPDMPERATIDWARLGTTIM